MNYHDKYKKFYQTKEWKNLRALKFAEANGLCENCKKLGKTTIGKEVHHIIPISKDWNRRYDKDNLILLCAECHREMHDRVSPLQQFNKFWDKL